MVDLKLLKERGISPEGLQPLLSTREPIVSPPTSIGSSLSKEDQDKATESDKRAKWIMRTRSRVQEGISRNLAEWQWSWAIDKVWDNSQHNFHPKIFADIAAGNMEGCCKILTSLNLNHLVETKTVGGKTEYSINEENVTTIVDLVRSYVTIRWAKIVNDRQLTPFLKFEPAHVTAAMRAKCEVLTDRVHVMSTQYSYFETMKQGVLKMLQYGTAIQFIVEEWHTETQLRKATEEDVKKAETGVDKQPVKLGDPMEFITREGLRYEITHPSRTFYDLAYPLYTLNSDSGCEYIGHWQVVPYRHLRKTSYWNTDKISIGTGSNPLVDASHIYFQTAYNACKMAAPEVQTPQAPTGNPAATAVTVGTGTTSDRQTAMTTQYYGTAQDDQGTLIVNYFEKLIPSECGLGNYKYPVWFRFVLAGDGCTFLYAAPLPGTPGLYYGYDEDAAKKKNPSLAMEILPYQYQFENLLTQVLYSCRQNLSNLTLINTDALDQGDIEKINGWGPRLWKKINVIGASFKKLQKMLLGGGQIRPDMLATSVSLPKANISEMINVLKTILDVLERVLVMSSHEVAQAASHEQTREEVRNIAQSSSSRQTFTATPVDLARDAWKRQIYTYLMAYGDDDFYATLPTETELTKEILDKMGFTYIDSDFTSKLDKYRRVRAKLSKLAIPLWSFASTRDGEDRSNDKEIAVVMATFARDILANPMTASAIGPDQALEMANMIAYFAGLPRDFKLHNTGQTPEEQRAQAQKQLQEVVQIALQQADQHIQKAIVPLLEMLKKHEHEIAVMHRVHGTAPPPLVEQAA